MNCTDSKSLKYSEIDFEFELVDDFDWPAGRSR